MGSVRWRRFDGNGALTARGEMQVKEIGPALLKSEEKAKIAIDKGAQHCIYAMKFYGPDNKLKSVDFMMFPLGEEQFRKLTRNCRNVLIYALHNRKTVCN